MMDHTGRTQEKLRQRMTLSHFGLKVVFSEIDEERNMLRWGNY